MVAFFHTHIILEIPPMEKINACILSGLKLVDGTFGVEEKGLKYISRENIFSGFTIFFLSFFYSDSVMRPDY